MCWDAVSSWFSGLGSTAADAAGAAGDTLSSGAGAIGDFASTTLPSATGLLDAFGMGGTDVASAAGTGLSAAPAFADFAAPLSAAAPAVSAASLAPDFGFSAASAVPQDLTVAQYVPQQAMPDSVEWARSGGEAANAAVPASIIDNAAGGTGFGLWDTLKSGAKELADTLGLKNLAPLAALGGLGYNLSNQGNIPYGGQLAANAQKLAAQGDQFASYINSGTLPPGAQQAVKTATNDAKAAIRSQYARMGMSGSSSEAQALAGIDRNAATQTFEIANKMLSQGLTETQMSQELYRTLMQVNQQQSANTGAAIGNLAMALGGGVNLKVGT